MKNNCEHLGTCEFIIALKNTIRTLTKTIELQNAIIVSNGLNSKSLESVQINVGLVKENIVVSLN